MPATPCWRKAGPAAPSSCQPAAPLPAQQPLEPVKPETLAILTEWMDKANIAPEEIQTLVAQKGHFPKEKTITEYPEKFVRGWLMHNWSQVVTTIQNNPEYTPF